ncbi:MAG: acyl-CoA dehydrogenase, partial [Thiomonas sp. 14-64-326]
MSYTAPIRDMMFDLEHLAGLESISKLPGFEDATPDTAAAVLEECGKFNRDVIAPLNREGDLHPSAWADGKVTTTPGFKQAFRQFVDGGWQGLQHSAEFGGQGLPKSISAACTEMLNSANLSFALCPLLSDGAIEALLTAGIDAQKQRYIPKLISGEWTGTMNLTEPQAGSDLALVRSRAEPQGDGTYRLFGQKIYITYGEHDMADNIVHLVLARLPDAPAGVKGISLFIVPKVLEDGRRNDVWCASIEHKLGIKASPTAVLIYGQSRPVDGSAAQSVSIVHHPDVRRMLMTMRALTEGCRALALVAASLHDVGRAHPDAGQRAAHEAAYEFLVPLVKGYSTEMSIEVASLGVQVHGGMGFIEETGAAQYYRDARILTIYEGTTAIQANDLVGRKTVRDGGALALHFAARVSKVEEALTATGDAQAVAMAGQLRQAREAYAQVVGFVAAHGKSDPNAVFAGSVPYLMLAGNLMAGWQMAQSWLATRDLPADEAAFAQ